jgi:predicted metal-dependent peptidase
MRGATQEPAAVARSEVEAWLLGFLRDASFLEAYPYYAAILARLTPVADPSVSRMAVSLHDGRFFLHLNVDAFVKEPQFLRGVLLHEVHHVVLGHLTHPKFMAVEEPELMDLAVEMSANEYIDEPLPPAITWRSYSTLGVRPGQSTWERYELLVRCLQSTGKRPRPSPHGDGAAVVDDHRFFARGKAIPGGMTQTGLLVERAVRESREERARESPPPPPAAAAKKARRNRKASEPQEEDGNGATGLPGDDGRRFLVAGRTPARLVEELFETTRAPEEVMDWRVALQLFVARARSPVHTWSRPSRRFPARIFEVPGRSWAPRRSENPRLLVAIDTSLSMTKGELEEIARQLVVLADRAHVTIAECDVSVARIYPFAGRIENVVGRGGTDLRPVFADDVLGAHDVDGVVYFTDGEGPFSRTPPPVPTLWVLTKPHGFGCAWGQKAWLREPRR